MNESILSKNSINSPISNDVLIKNNNQPVHTFSRASFSHPQQPKMFTLQSNDPSILSRGSNIQEKIIQEPLDIEQEVLEQHQTVPDQINTHLKIAQLFLNKVKYSKQYTKKKENGKNKILPFLQQLKSKFGDSKLVYINNYQNIFYLIYSLLIVIFTPLGFINDKFDQFSFMKWLSLGFVLLLLLETTQYLIKLIITNNQVKLIKKFIIPIITNIIIIVLIFLHYNSQTQLNKISTLYIYQILLILSVKKKIRNYIELQVYYLFFYVVFCHFITCIQISFEEDTYFNQSQINQFIYYLNTYKDFTQYIVETSPIITLESINHQIFMIVNFIILTYLKIIFLINLILYTLDQIPQHIQQQNASNLKNRIKKANCSKDIQNKMIKLINTTKDTANEENQIFLENYFKNNQKLINEFKNELFSKIIQSSNIFKQFSQNLIDQLGSKIIITNQQKDDELHINFDQQNLSIYFFENGNIFEKISNEYYVSQLNIYVGEYSFFSGQQHSQYIKIKKNTKVYQLRRNDFLELVYNYKIDQERCLYIRDQLLYNNNLQIINNKCYVCNSNNHLTKQCPCLFFQKNQLDISETQRKSQNQIRQSLQMSSQRRTRLKFKALVNLKQLTYSIDVSNLTSESEILQYDQNLPIIQSDNQSNSNKQRFSIFSLRENNLKIIPEEDISDSSSFSQLKQQCSQISKINLIQQSRNDVLGSNQVLPYIQVQNKMLSEKQLLPPNIIKSLHNLADTGQNTYKQTKISFPSDSEFLILQNKNPLIENIFILDFDRAKDFQIYYPEFNINVVMFKIKYWLKNKIKQSKQKLKIREYTFIRQDICEKFNII